MKPYLSIIVAGRNDNYGGDFLGRLQLFVTHLATALADHRVRSEILIVEWNPPPETPSFDVALNPPEPDGFTSLRIIQVPSEVHNRFLNANKIGLFEYLAKNVALRRATGEFLLVTNPDILFSDQLIQELSKRRLSHGSFYRADRYDFAWSFHVPLSPKKAVSHAKRHVHTVHVRHRTSTPAERQKCELPVSGWQRRIGLISGHWPGTYDDPEHRRPTKNPIVALDDTTQFFDGLHTSASGDFILAPRYAWHQIRGFPEKTDTYIHLDSYACHQLKLSGYRQMLFVPPCMIFHADHARDARVNRPATDQWEEDLRLMRAGELSPVLNGDDWGLATTSLAETTLDRNID